MPGSLRPGWSPTFHVGDFVEGIEAVKVAAGPSSAMLYGNAHIVPHLDAAAARWRAVELSCWWTRTTG